MMPASRLIGRVAAVPEQAEVEAEAFDPNRRRLF
jgi:hypothetical protein